MVIDFRTEADRGLLTAALRHALGRSLRLFWLCGVILLLPAVLAVLTDDPVMAVVWVFAAVLFWALPWLVVRSAVQANWKSYGRTIDWQVSDEGVRMSSDLMESLVRWSALETVELIPDQLLLKINRQQVIPVPVAGLGPQDREALLGLLRARGPAGAGGAPDGLLR
ncbi:YcxB family protein [Micromonospora krabiensis]|uniref:YcxB-like protein n=1 Tax=Micromonospora krabiensis TaxID=307121 RepID=A0A1C3N432_9ACTN|nr:YcxB family protein [Micromonospora krabiensis]SBV27333.1 YcxB-like protein [Micromonospora krabiensis]